MRLLAVDPGVHQCGCAHFLDGRLVDAALVVRDRNHWGDGPAGTVESVGIWFGLRPDQFAVERQRVYPGRQGRRTDPNDLLDLSLVTGGLIYAFRQAKTKVIYPADWKGQTPKKVMNHRVFSRLTVEEQLALGTKNHNVLDAVGIGLYYLGRL